MVYTVRSARMPIKMVRIVVAPTAVRGSKNNDDSSKKKRSI